MHNEKKKYLACPLEVLKKSKCFGLEMLTTESSTYYFLVYHENTVYSYLNRCPHTGVNLDWLPHQFLDTTSKFIQCATHGALFDIENGSCLRGPCVGEQLQIVENSVSEGNIYLIL
jgi:nitrite reductase/ring-hydroxylating ferredoxin subunit